MLIFILEDNILNHLNGYEITKKSNNSIVYLESFSGVRIKCMENYVQPTVKTSPDHIVIHIDTNDLPSKKESAEISSNIMDLTLKLKSGKFEKATNF